MMKKIAKKIVRKMKTQKIMRMRIILL